jgi:hypothetical protein
MEKISHIVRGNARTAAVDLKGSSAVRPGAPAFGRPIGESPQSPVATETTAAKATAVLDQMNEKKKDNQREHVAEQMADSFFMTRIRRPDEEPTKAIAKVGAKAETDVDEVADLRDSEAAPPTGFTPRGSYVDVRA